MPNLNSPDRAPTPPVETAPAAPAARRAPDQLRQPINLAAQQELLNIGQEIEANRLLDRPEVQAMQQDLETKLAEATDGGRPLPASQPFEVEEFNSAVSSLRNTLKCVLYLSLKDAGPNPGPDVLAMAVSRFRGQAAELLQALAQEDGTIQLSEFRAPSPDFERKIIAIVGAENAAAAMNFSIANRLRLAREQNPAELPRELEQAYLARGRALLARQNDPTFAAESKKLLEDFISHATDLFGGNYLTLDQARALVGTDSELGRVLGELDATGKISQFAAKLDGEKAEKWLQGRADSRAVDASEAAKLAIRNPNGYSLANKMDLGSMALYGGATLAVLGAFGGWLEQGNSVFKKGIFWGEIGLAGWALHDATGDKPDALFRELLGNKPVPDPKSPEVKERLEQRIDQSPQLVAYLAALDSDALSDQSPLDFRAGQTVFQPDQWTRLVGSQLAAERAKSKPDQARIRLLESARTTGQLPKKDQEELYFLAALARRSGLNIPSYLKRNGNLPEPETQTA